MRRTPMGTRTMIDQRLVTDHPASKLARRLLVESGKTLDDEVTPLLQLTRVYLENATPANRPGNYLVDLEEKAGELTRLPQVEQAALFVADWETLQKELERGNEWETLKRHLDGVYRMLVDLKQDGTINPDQAGALLADNLFCCLRHADGFGPL
jgi:hypothetical protein